MMVGDVLVHCAGGCGREAEWCKKFPGGALYWCRSCRIQPVKVKPCPTCGK